MCGISGILQLDRSLIDPQVLKRFSESLSYRGPDDFGFLGWSGIAPVTVTRNPEDLGDAWIGLSHRRLSILDVSEAGWQPMVSYDGRYSIVFNGEIYNYLELQAELKVLGHTFYSHSDTEVLLAAYSQWGSDALTRLVGMFAFAILDTHLNKIFLARDFFGIKPLYYTHWNQGFAFASEIKTLLTLPQVPARANPQAVYDYLCFGLTEHSEETIFANIYQLPAAHYLEISLTSYSVECKPVRYWRVETSSRCKLSFNEASDQLRSLFLDSIRLHLRSDVPVGAALSGGIDSSSIVMAMRYLEPDMELHTFTYTASDPRLNEGSWADIVGQASNAIMHKVQPLPEDLIRDLDRLIYVQDQPFGSTSIYAQHRIFKLAHEAGIKVMLDGQGADELLGGYPPFLGARLASLVRQGSWKKATSFLRHASQSPTIRSRAVLMWGGAFLLPDGLKGAARSLIGKEFVPAWMNVNWFSDRGVRMSSIPSDYEESDILRRELQNNLENRLLSLLSYEDRNSMVHSIESRVPFLTPKLANFAFSLPEEYIVSPHGTTKKVFREAMRGIVPDSILDRRDKIGFATPEQNWLETLRPWVDQVLDSNAANCIPSLNILGVKQEWKDILGGRKSFDFRVWRWINIIRWAELYDVDFT
jgi:asparagine synthase (glutamine-hydrolysing)